MEPLLSLEKKFIVTATLLGSVWLPSFCGRVTSLPRGVKSNHPPKTNALTGVRHFDGGDIRKKLEA
jgi:hypothetical protein